MVVGYIQLFVDQLFQFSLSSNERIACRNRKNKRRKNVNNFCHYPTTIRSSMDGSSNKNTMNFAPAPFCFLTGQTYLVVACFPKKSPFYCNLTMPSAFCRLCSISFFACFFVLLSFCHLYAMLILETSVLQLMGARKMCSLILNVICNHGS